MGWQGVLSVGLGSRVWGWAPMCGVRHLGVVKMLRELLILAQAVRQYRRAPTRSARLDGCLGSGVRGGHGVA